MTSQTIPNPLCSLFVFLECTCSVLFATESQYTKSFLLSEILRLILFTKIGILCGNFLQEGPHTNPEKDRPTVHGRHLCEAGAGSASPLPIPATPIPLCPCLQSLPWGIFFLPIAIPHRDPQKMQKNQRLRCRCRCCESEGEAEAEAL